MKLSTVVSSLACILPMVAAEVDVLASFQAIPGTQGQIQSILTNFINTVQKNELGHTLSYQAYNTTLSNGNIEYYVLERYAKLADFQHHLTTSYFLADFGQLETCCVTPGTLVQAPIATFVYGFDDDAAGWTDYLPHPPNRAMMERRKVDFKA